ncbi:Activating signal cointegrator 1 [Cichlidogyrus casuarinus]|uniref:Activating signal cointegrator 1 n=1 Tax=Cichlidogyrus casuarinus TaxID=1844966 RepID=A0ABD2QMT1_9PLAT
MEKCVEILSPKLGQKGAADFINFMCKLDDNREIESRVSNFLDPANKHFDAVVKFLTQENINAKLKNKSPEVQPKNTIKNVFKKDKTMGKQKPKFVPLFQEGAHEGFVALIPGRYPCQCLATVHKLVNNCMFCGRIVCNQEGSGLCYFCGNMVCTTEELNTINSGSKVGQKLKNKLLNIPWNDGIQPIYMTNQEVPQEAISDTALREAEEKLIAAILHRDKLVIADSQSIARNRVIDDELDYFASESGYKWLTPEVRDRVSKRIEELKSQRHASGFGASKITIDFAGRKIEHHDDRLEKIDQLFSQEPILDEDKKENAVETVLRTLDHLEVNSDTYNGNRVLSIPVQNQKSNHQKLT